MAGVNKVIVVGRVGNIETRYTPSGDAVCSFSVATSEEWKDKQTGEKKEKTEWHRVVVWRKLGKLQTRSWDKDGQTHYTTEIVASTVQFLGGRSERTEPAQESGGGGQGRSQDAPEDDIPF